MKVGKESDFGVNFLSNFDCFRSISGLIFFVSLSSDSIPISRSSQKTSKYFKTTLSVQFTIFFPFFHNLLNK